MRHAKPTVPKEPHPNDFAASNTQPWKKRLLRTRRKAPVADPGKRLTNAVRFANPHIDAATNVGAANAVRIAIGVDRVDGVAIHFVEHDADIPRLGGRAGAHLAEEPPKMDGSAPQPVLVHGRGQSRKSGGVQHRRHRKNDEKLDEPEPPEAARVGGREARLTRRRFTSDRPTVDHFFFCVLFESVT